MSAPMWTLHQKRKPDQTVPHSQHASLRCPIRRDTATPSAAVECSRFKECELSEVLNKRGQKLRPTECKLLLSRWGEGARGAGCSAPLTIGGPRLMGVTQCGGLRLHPLPHFMQQECRTPPPPVLCICWRLQHHGK